MALLGEYAATQAQASQQALGKWAAVLQAMAADASLGHSSVGPSQ